VARAQKLNQREAIHAWQHDIDYCGIKPVPFDCLNCAFSRTYAGNLYSTIPEVLGNRLGQYCVILNEYQIHF